MLVKPQNFQLPEPLALDCGRTLKAVNIRYETAGTLLPDRSNAVLITHALSGDAHVCGRHSPEDPKPGWWDEMIGPGKAIDTDRYFVICSNVLGSCAGSCLTLLCLAALRLREQIPPSPRIPIRHRLFQAAVPLALADVLKSGINTTENLMVPKRLARNPSITDPLACFGVLSGMVFPVLMFPACILFGLAELLIPELARCAAAGSKQRITYLVKRSLRVSMLYGAIFAGLEFLLAEALCLRLYGNPQAGRYLKLYALLIPMLYCDAITDAMTKGLGQQKVCVRYNILTSALDVLFLYLLLPRLGMEGYFISFFGTHLLNFCLSLRRLLKITGISIPFYIPAMTAAAAITSVWSAASLSVPAARCICYLCLLLSLLYLFRVISGEDLSWVRGLFRLSRRENAA